MYVTRSFDPDESRTQDLVRCEDPSRKYISESALDVPLIALQGGGEVQEVRERKEIEFYIPAFHLILKQIVQRMWNTISRFGPTGN